MRSLNKVILIGNLTRDPDTRALTEFRRVSRQAAATGNQSITLFGIATNRDWVTKDGRREQSAEFHEVVCFGHLGEIAKLYCKKGSLVHIEGYLKTRSWDDAAGIKKFRTEIIAENFIMLDKRPSAQGSTAQAGPRSGLQSENTFDVSQSAISIENPITI